MKHPTVFISYSHDSPEHADRVLALADRLVQDGIDCILDQYEESPPEGWPKWMDRQIERSDFVLVICTETYHRRVMGTEEEGKGLGVRWESTLAYQDIYDAGGETTRFIPVLFQSGKVEHIPKPLRGAARYYVDTEQGYEDLYRRLTNQPRKIKPKLSKLRKLPPRQRKQDFFAVRVSLAKLPSTSPDLFGREEELTMLDAAWEDPQTHIVSLVAWGGVGKTALVNKHLLQMGEDHYRGAERVYGWSFYSQGAREGGQASADPFIAAALEWFGDPDPTKGSPWDRGERLAELVKKQQTILILDGLEPLQYPPGEMGGRLKDPSLVVLLRQLARHNPGLVIITTRLPVDDLKEFVSTSVKRIYLEHLSPEAGAAYLAHLGVKGTPEELRQAVDEFEGHALALTLLGSYLAVMHGGDIRQRDKIARLIRERKQGGHARRVMESYERWFQGQPELNILRMMGLFDRPAEGGAIEALKAGPAISGLTSELQGLSHEDWQYAVDNLRAARLLAGADPHQPDTLDCHPLVRDHFGAKLQESHPDGWKEAHSRLYEYYQSQAPEYPDTLEEMAPLYAAVAHGCQAGRHQEALDDVYRRRIQRGHEGFSARKLGAFGADLAALSSFFEPPWYQPVAGLTEDSKSFVLNQAGVDLQALGRLVEAIQLMQASLEAAIAKEDWQNAAIAAGILSPLYLTSGDLAQALATTQQSVDLADRSGDAFRRMASRAALADALHWAGRLAEAEAAFREAEEMQKERQPQFPLLYSLQGYQYCDLLLSQEEVREVQNRASQTIEIARQNNWLLDIALDHLSLGRAYLLQALQGGSHDPSTGLRTGFSQAAAHLNQAVDGLRQAGRQDMLPFGLLARAALHRVMGSPDLARADLEEAAAIAKRGGMRLHEADCHLEYARLHLACGEQEKAQQSLAKAKAMIEEMGYHRRDREVEEPEAQPWWEKVEEIETHVEVLEPRMRGLIKEYSYQEARDLLWTIAQEDPGRAQLLKDELGFLFDLDRTAELDLEQIEKDSRRVEWRQQIWEILSQRNNFPLKSAERDLSQEAQVREDISDHEGPSDSFVIEEDLAPHEKGEKLEVATLQLFQQFFTMGEENQELILNSLRRQSAGTQFGHDVSFNFKFEDTVRDNQNVRCHVECKNYKEDISLKLVAEKLVQEEVARTGIHHWILISPYADPSNDLKQALDYWAENLRYPFDIQVWSPETQVQEFFGLNPTVYDQFYQVDDRILDPHHWTEGKRQRVYKKWRDKLNPPLRLPEGWGDYIRAPQYLLFSNETHQEYDRLYANYVPMRCKDSAGNLLGSLEDYVGNWLHDEKQPVLFLLGEFGDGKTAFTYILARKIAEDFFKDPSTGWIPVRFALREYYKMDDSGEFLSKRLARFGANLKGWTALKNDPDYRILVILDGFDEMSIKLDPKTITKNIKSLEECCQEFEGMKILITSRTHFFKNPRDVERLRERIHSPEMIYLAPITRYSVIKHLEECTVTPEEKEALRAIRKLHDPVGLGTKPLFLQMIKETMQGALSNLTELPSDLNELQLYDAYVYQTLRERKNQFLEDDQVEVLPSEIFENLVRLLGEIAWELHISGERYILLSKFRETYGDLAEKLWKTSEADQKDRESSEGDFATEEDATARVGIRSLLTCVKTDDVDDQWPVDFCHRSMREYFVAKRIYRFLDEEPDTAKSVLANILISHEILDFAVELLRESSDKQWEKRLLEFIRATKAAEKAGYLGANAVTLLFRLKKELPGDDWSGLVLDQADLAGADLSHKNFSHTSLRNANLDNVNFEEADFRYCDLTGVRVEETARVQALAVHPLENKILAAYGDGNVREWEISHPRKSDSWIITTETEGDIGWVGFSPTEDICALVGDEMTFYDRVHPGTLSRRTRFQIKPAYRTVIARDQTLLVMSEVEDFQGQAQVIDIIHHEIVNSIDLPLTSLCDHLGRSVFVFTQEREVRVERIDGDGKRRSLQTEVDDVGSLCVYGAEGGVHHLLACGQKNGTIRIWKLNLNGSDLSCEEIVSHPTHDGAITSIAFFDEERIVSGGVDRRICILNFGDEHADPDEMLERTLQLSIKCRGMKIEGIKGAKERKKLEELIAKASNLES